MRKLRHQEEKISGYRASSSSYLSSAQLPGVSLGGLGPDGEEMEMKGVIEADERKVGEAPGFL